MSEKSLKAELATQFALALYRVLEERRFTTRRDFERLQCSDTPVNAVAMELTQYLMEDRRIDVLIEDVRHWLDVEWDG